MKKAILFMVFLSVFTAILQAQYTLDWMQGAGNYSKTSVMGVVDSDDNLIVTGYWQNYKMFTRKYDVTGTFLWEAADASGTQGLYEKSNWITSDAGDNIFVIGNIYSYSSSTGWDYPSTIVALKYTPLEFCYGKPRYPLPLPLPPLIGSILKALQTVQEIFT